jgi:hypothetical protein
MLSQLNEYAQMNFAGHRPGGALAKTSDSAPDPITPTLQAVQNSRFWPALERGKALCHAYSRQIFRVKRRGNQVVQNSWF